jgi:putative colanic acid biosynthesis acetyltransferase WcaF
MIELSKYKSPSGSVRILAILWYFVNFFFFNSWVPFPNRFKTSLLRLFGAEVGKGLVIKPRVRIKAPWNLILGNYVWIGEDVWIDNFALVHIGNHVCISQAVLILNGNHNFRKPTFDFFSLPIYIGSHTWVTTKCVILSGAKIGDGIMLPVCSVIKSGLYKPYEN